MVKGYAAARTLWLKRNDSCGFRIKLPSFMFLASPSPSRSRRSLSPPAAEAASRATARRPRPHRTPASSPAARPPAPPSSASSPPSAPTTPEQVPRARGAAREERPRPRARFDVEVQNATPGATFDVIVRRQDHRANHRQLSRHRQARRVPPQPRRCPAKPPPRQLPAPSRSATPSPSAKQRWRSAASDSPFPALPQHRTRPSHAGRVRVVLCRGGLHRRPASPNSAAATTEQNRVSTRASRTTYPPTPRPAAPAWTCAPAWTRPSRWPPTPGSWCPPASPSTCTTRVMPR